VKTIRHASYDEFVTWYLRREYTKRGYAIPDLGNIAEQRQTMQRNHDGKLRSWFPRGTWSLAEIQSENELLTLICLAGRWPRNSGLLTSEQLNNRTLLRQFIVNANEVNYFAEAGRPTLCSENMEKRRLYVSRLRTDTAIRFNGADRIVLCSPCADEKRRNPVGSFYLHDGLGRMLAYAYLISRSEIPFSPIEAFLAEEVPA
jgi:hypothetical protein